MNHYHRRIYSDYRKDVIVASNFGMPDELKGIISSKDFAQVWAPHIMEIAHRKNVEYSSVGVLDRNDLIQECSLCFLIALKRVNWDRIHNLPQDEQEKALWGFIKKNVILDLNKRIRALKDGIKITQYEQEKREKQMVNFDAISSLFPQLLLENSFADNAIQDDYWNDVLIDILNEHLIKFVPDPRKRSVLEWKMGIDGVKLSVNEIADRLNMTFDSVHKSFQRTLKSLRSEESMNALAIAVDGTMVPTGANIVEYLEDGNLESL